MKLQKRTFASKIYHRYNAVCHGDLYFMYTLNRLTVSKSLNHLNSRFPGHENECIKLRSPINKGLYVLFGTAVLVCGPTSLRGV